MISRTGAPPVAPGRRESWRRYAALARAVLRARRAAFDPFKLTWIVTERCSLRCSTCHLWARAPHQGPELECVERVLASNHQLTWLNLSGGDPVERCDAPELMGLVAREGRDLALLDFPTAGQDPSATLAALEPLLASPIPRIYVTVSLDGPDAVHDRIRRCAGAAARARQTFELLKGVRRPGFHVVVGMTLSADNLAGSLDDPRAVLPEGVPVDDLHLNIAHHSSHYYRNSSDVGPPPDAALRVVEHVRRRRRTRLSPLDLVEHRYWRHARRHLTDGDPGRSCGALRASVFLAADGRVYPCSIFDRPLGHIADVDYSLRRIGELNGAATTLDAVERRDCPRCWSPCEAFPTLLLGRR